MERNEENEMLKLSEIDVNKCFIDDTVGFWDGFWERRNGLGAAPVYADPDSASETLRNYHQALWSRKLPNGEVMALQKGKKSDYLTWNGMRFASDSIATQHRYIKCEHVIRQVESQMPNYRSFVYDTTRFTYTIGGMIIFPKLRGSMNQDRGTKTIGDGAFYYCNKLKEVKFNEGLQEIGNDTFSRCDLIKNLDFPETLRYIGNHAFHPGLLRTEDIVVNLKSIPCNFIAAFVKEERSPGTICINVHVDNAVDVFDFVIPEYMSHHGFLTTNTAFDMLPDKKAAETLNEAYVFAISTTSRSITAFKAYRKTRDEKIKKEIQENYLLTALSIIAFMNEDDFMDFLKLVEIRYNKRILNRLQKKGWLPSVSYILQNAKETEKEDFALS